MSHAVQFLAGFHPTAEYPNAESRGVTMNRYQCSPLCSSDTDHDLFIHMYTFCYIQVFLETHGFFLSIVNIFQIQMNPHHIK